MSRSGRRFNWRLSFLILIALASFVGCHKPADREAYERVLATMSVREARNFFAEYPKSRYRDLLVEKLEEISREERSEEGARLILEAIPKDHPHYATMKRAHEARFGGLQPSTTSGPDSAGVRPPAP